jgi:hypothetical protein
MIQRKANGRETGNQGDAGVCQFRHVPCLSATLAKVRGARKPPLCQTPARPAPGAPQADHSRDWRPAGLGHEGLWKRKTPSAQTGADGATNTTQSSMKTRSRIPQSATARLLKQPPAETQACFQRCPFCDGVGRTFLSDAAARNRPPPFSGPERPLKPICRVGAAGAAYAPADSGPGCHQSTAPCRAPGRALTKSPNGLN